MTMSNESTPPGAPADRSSEGPVRRAFHLKLWTFLVEGRFGLNFLRRYWRRLLLVFVALLLPLWGFAELADEVADGEPFGFDEPLEGNCKFQSLHSPPRQRSLSRTPCAVSAKPVRRTSG